MATFQNFFAAPTAPLVVLEVQEHRVDMTLQFFLNEHHLPFNLTNFLIFVFYHRAAILQPDCILLSPTVVGGGYAARAVADGVCYRSADNGVTALNVLPPDGFNHAGLTRAHMNLISYYWLNSSRFTADLVVAASYKEVSAGNIVSYFRQFKLEINESPFFATAVNRVARNVNNHTAEGRALISNTIWGTYRLNATSIGSVFTKVVVTYSAAAITRILTPARYAVFVAIAAAPWDRELAATADRNSIGILACALRAARCLPDDWHSGNNCRDALGPGLMDRYEALFSRLLAISTQRDLLNAANTVDDVLNLFGM